jgi:hypothetical protein
MSLQRFTIGICHTLLRFPHKGPAYSTKDYQQRPLLHPSGPRRNTMSFPHSTEQDTQPIVFLISK